MSDSTIRRIGVLTGGGDCPGLNAVIRAVAKTAMLQYGLEVWGIADGFLGLIEDHIHRLSLSDVSNILTRGGTILGTSNRANPARFAVAKDAKGNPIFEDVPPTAVKHAHDHSLEAIICIGGDGTMTGAAGLAEHGLNFVGVPKTIDNDLEGTDVTFGFQTAVGVGTEALDRIHTTASSHHRVMIVELMGRNAGWLTLHAGVASGSDVILIPEIPFSLEGVVACCVTRSKHGKACTIIAVSEGAKPRGGQQIVRQIIKDSPDPIRLGGIGQFLADQIERMCGLECRATILGHVQRGGTPTAEDRVLATLFGHKALELALAGRFGELVVMRNNQITSVPFAEVAGKQRLVPLDHPLIKAARGVGTCFGDECG
jgi:ATP-dependent phosphofructokinase / diphosphate-dependent phosphofructokinase